MCQRQKLEIFQLHNHKDLEEALNTTVPAALAWDLTNAQPNEWALVRRLRHYGKLSEVPFILYSQPAQQAGQSQELGLTGFVVKSSNAQTLLDVILSICPEQATGPILIVDDDAQVRAAHQALIEKGLPGYSVQAAANGENALTLMDEDVPALVLLDLVMPGLSGADVLDQMRANSKLRQVPVMVLSNKLISLEDVRRIEKHIHVTLQSKGIWSDEETLAALNRAVSSSEILPAHTSALVKRAIAYFHQNYMRAISRWEIAEAVGVSEDYLTRVFNRELDISP